MGNKLSCSCAPLIKKAYRYEDTPFQQQRRRDGHLLRLWAEVFHVSAASGAVRWQQISEDLVPVNITCIQDSPECVFHITAYNSQVEKILDVRLAQPGTRLGQASECFVYWKDTATGDTWGLNFTSPLDAKQFRELCSPTFKISRKASSSYSLRLNEPPSKKQNAEKGGTNAKRKPQSTPSSPSRRGGYNAAEELQCTCMAADTLHRQRNGRVRYVATLPKTAFRQDASGHLVAYPSTMSVQAASQQQQQQRGQTRSGQQADQQHHPHQQQQHQQQQQQPKGGHHSQTTSAAYIRTAQNSRAQYAQSVRKDQARSVDSSLYHMRKMQSEHSGGDHHHPQQQQHHQQQTRGTVTKSNVAVATTPSTEVKSRSKSSDDVRRTVATGTDDLQLDSNTLKKMLHPLSGNQSSPEGNRTATRTSTTGTNTMITPTAATRRESLRSLMRPTSVPNWSYDQSMDNGTDVRSRFFRSEEGRRRSLERTQCVDFTDQSPPSDHYLSDTQNRCYATTPTPSSSGDEGPPLGSKINKLNQQRGGQRGGDPKERSSSPTIKILQEYEQHLRNALAKGNEDTYSLNTFETLLSQSMENVVALMREVQSELDAIRREEQQLDNIPGKGSGRPYWARSHTLPTRGSSLPPPAAQGGSSTSDLYTAIKKSSGPIMDSLSIDGSLPFMTGLGGIHPQASFESTDSKAYLTSSEMSDDERLSLTTAISDDDDGESRDSPYRAKSGAAAAAFQCTGAVRKAGFLSVKKWLLRKRHQVELARKRGWKGYWVCLKGTTLLFYPCDSRDGRAIESKPRHLIIIDGAIMQPIPEHPKRDFIFCLSTAFGDAYLFQAPCQVELENWISAIHNACGAAFARHRGKTGTLHLLQEETHRIDQQVESDAKLKHMAELQLTVVADIESKKQLQEQIKTYEENLEQFHCEQFRLRCYMASVQGTELPNPKTLLAHVSKPTKSILNRLGVFTVSSFHAYICARSPSMLTNIISGRGGTRRRGPSIVSGPATASSTRSLSRHSSLGSRQGSTTISRSAELPGDKILQLVLPDESIQAVHVRGAETVEDVLWLALADKQISPNDYFIRIKRVNGDYYAPSRHEVIDHLPVYDVMQVCAKILYQVELSRHSLEQLFGFSVEAELVENSADHHNQDELCVYVSRVEEKSLAAGQGLNKGDEIMVINGAIVSDLDMMYIESVLQEELSLCMMLRSCRTEPPDFASTVRSTDEYIESLVCPPPPSDGHISDEMIGKLIVPSPQWVQERNRLNTGHPTTGSSGGQSGGSASGPGSLQGAQASSSATTSLPLPVSGEQIAETLLKTAEQVTSEYCRLATASSHHQQQPTPQQQQQHQLAQQAAQVVQSQTLPHQHSRTSQKSLLSASSHGSTYSQHSVEEVEPQGIGRRVPLSDADKLRKVIKELVDTERTYVEHLNNLLEIYLEPMKKQSLVSNQDIHTLFGNIQEIVHFQRTFLDSLESAVNNEGDGFERYQNPPEFKNVLFALGNSFLLYADKFKLYSSFCASHSKASKILHPSNETAQNPALIEFLNSRSRGQHAYSLESYLIKPIQRILKYPLLLQQLKHLTDSNSDEHKHLTQALKGMERVAEHINEMQRIHEEYGAIFDHLQRQHLKSNKTLIELSPVELLYYGGVDWLNINEFLGKIKKGLDLHAMCFVFKQAVVFLCKERIRQKKKLVAVSSKLSEVEIIRYQVLIPVTEVQVRATSVRSDINTASDANTSTTHFLWELIHLRCTQISGGTQRRTEKVYQLSNSTNEFRNCFLRTIRQIIRESVRNMAVPLTKPSVMTKPVVHQTTSGSSAQPTTTASHSLPKSSIQSISQKDGNQSQSSSSSAQQVRSAGEKPAVRQKPLPPPRAPTTTKTTSGPSTAQQQQAQKDKEKEHHHHHGGKPTVSCGLCGADVGLGSGEAAARSSLRSSPMLEVDKSDHSSSSGRGRFKADDHQRLTVERQESVQEEMHGSTSPIWKPRESTR